jgi:hypothetical protein
MKPTVGFGSPKNVKITACVYTTATFANTEVPSIALAAKVFIAGGGASTTASQYYLVKTNYLFIQRGLTNLNFIGGLVGAAED